MNMYKTHDFISNQRNLWAKFYWTSHPNTRIFFFVRIHQVNFNLFPTSFTSSTYHKTTFFLLWNSVGHKKFNCRDKEFFYIEITFLSLACRFLQEIFGGAQWPSNLSNVAIQYNLFIIFFLQLGFRFHPKSHA